MTQKTSSSFTICHIFALEINYFPVLLSVRALLARLPKRNKRKVVSGSRVTLPVNFACKPRLSFNPLAKVTLAVGSPYLAPSKQGLNRFLRLSLNENLLLLNFRLHFFQSVPCVWEFQVLKANSNFHTGFLHTSFTATTRLFVYFLQSLCSNIFWSLIQLLQTNEKKNRWALISLS